MQNWDIPSLDLKPRLPEILSSTPEARAIVLDLRTGEGLPDHEVHERAWIVVLAGNVEITSATGERVSGGSGLLVEFAATERHEVVARSDARLLLLLTPLAGHRPSRRYDAAPEALRAPPRRQETCGDMTRRSEVRVLSGALKNISGRLRAGTSRARQCYFPHQRWLNPLDR